MNSATNDANDAQGLFTPEQALAAFEEHRNTVEKLAEQEALWAKHAAALLEPGVGEPLRTSV